MNNRERNREIDRRVGQFMNGVRAVDTSRLAAYFTVAELTEIKARMQYAGLQTVGEIIDKKRLAEKDEPPTIPDTVEAADKAILATFYNPRLRRMIVTGKAGLDGTWDKVRRVFADHEELVVAIRDYYDLDVSPGWLEREYESDKEWMKS